ncbi:uncharacterized protein [Cherax quadricarinatus]
MKPGSLRCQQQRSYNPQTGQDRNQSCQSSLPRNFRTLVIKMPRSRSRSKKRKSGKKWKQSSTEKNDDIRNNIVSEVRTVGTRSEVPPSSLPLSAQPSSPSSFDGLVTSIDNSEISTSNAQLKQHLIEHHCSLVEEKAGLSTYEIKTKDLHKDEDHKIQVMTIGPENKEAIKSVLLLGETGAGKTRAIDAMINFLFGVNFEDNFRFKLKDQVDRDYLHQVESQTEYVTAYIVYHQEGMPLQCNYMLIDTPGFGDTREDYEKIAIERMTHFLTNDYGIDDLNCVALVAKANQNRISAHHINMLKEFSSVLGRNIGSVTRLLATFASDDTCEVVNVVKHAQVDFVNFYKMDNWPLYVSHSNNDYSRNILACLKYRWMNMQEIYSFFFKDLENCLAVSLKQTRNLLLERKLLEETKNRLMKNVKCLAELDDTIEKFKYSLKDLMVELSDINYIYTVRREKNIAVLVEGDYHVHNCSKCRSTCTGHHENLTFGEIAGPSAAVGLIAGRVFSPLAGVGALCTIAAALATSCSKVPSTGKCSKIGCFHNWMDHKMEKKEYITLVTHEEKIDYFMKNMYDKKEEQITEMKKKIEQNEKARNIINKRLISDAKALEGHTRNISELSLGHEILSPPLIIDELIILERENIGHIHLLKMVKEMVSTSAAHNYESANLDSV